MDKIHNNIKPIHIIGQNNKFQIKKLIPNNDIITNVSIQDDILKVEKIIPIKHKKTIITDDEYIKRKINGYKQQDKKRELTDTIITFDELKLKLLNHKVCYYCNCELKLTSTIINDPCQWTLDRINNDIGHTNDNTIIACLGCNLKRRRIDYNKYNFTKKLSTSSTNIIKSNHIIHSDDK